MAKIVFDIETVGHLFDELDPATQEHLLRFARTEEEEQKERDSLAFYPVTARVVTVAMLEEESDKAFVYYVTPERPPDKKMEGKTEYLSTANEKQLLELFWQRMAKYDQFVTFNGRGFDCPFLLIRSAINKVKPTRNLMPDRYRSQAHIDLMEKLTYLGATRRRFSLHMWCQAFRIKSPKQEGVGGAEIKDLFKQGRYFDIARYCLGDVWATRELFRAWNAYLNLPG